MAHKVSLTQPNIPQVRPWAIGIAHAAQSSLRMHHVHDRLGRLRVCNPDVFLNKVSV